MFLDTLWFSVSVGTFGSDLYVLPKLVSSDNYPDGFGEQDFLALIGLLWGLGVHWRGLSAPWGTSRELFLRIEFWPKGMSELVHDH